MLSLFVLLFFIMFLIYPLNLKTGLVAKKLHFEDVAVIAPSQCKQLQKQDSSDAFPLCVFEGIIG